MKCKHCFHWTELGEECCECSHLVKHPPMNKSIKAIARVRELHYPVNDGGCSDPECCSPSDSEDFCIVCGDYGYPCETIKILDGEY